MAWRLLIRKPVRFPFILLCALALPSVAFADGVYLGLGAGNGASIEGGLGARFDGEDQASGRALLGWRGGDFALEGVWSVTDLVGRADGAAYAGHVLGVDLKYHLPLLLGFELYVKGGLHFAGIDGPEPGDSSATGHGYGYGVGLLWALRALQVVEAGIWLDLAKEVTTYELADGSSAGAGMRMIMLGFSVGTGI